MVPPNTRVQRTRSSPSALRSPLTRRPLGRAINSSAIAAVALVTVFACTSTGKNKPEAQGRVPGQCGVQAGRMVSAEEALCIARLEGLPAGRSANPTSSAYMPWTVVPAGLREPDSSWPQWRVSSTVSPPDQCPSGSEMLIDRTTGVVIKVGHHVPFAKCD
jgi:hypothetical protein